MYVQDLNEGLTDGAGVRAVLSLSWLRLRLPRCRRCETYEIGGWQ